MRELLGRLFLYHGFEAVPPESGQSLMLRQGSLKVEVLLVEGPAELGESGLAALLSPPTKAERRIVASLGRFSAQARRLAEERRVQLWDRKRLEEEAGRMVLAEMDTRPAAAAGKSLLEPLLAGEMGAPDQEAGEESRDESGTAGPADAGAAQAAFPEGEVMVQPRIQLDEARALVGERLEGAFRFDLQMLPHYCFSYSCEPEEHRGGGSVRRGTILVNGITGEALEWRREGVSRLEEGRIRMEPSLEQPQALENARQKVISLSTRVVHTKKEKGSVTVYEKRTVRPAEGAIRIELIGLVYLPVWCIEGGNGAVILDALRGKVVKEELFQASKGASGDSVGAR